MAKELLPDALWARIAPRTAWDATGGWSNGRSPGSTASGAEDPLLAFLQLGCALISLRFLGSPRPTRENGRPGPPRTASARLET